MGYGWAMGRVSAFETLASLVVIPPQIEEVANDWPSIHASKTRCLHGASLGFASDLGCVAGLSDFLSATTLQPAPVLGLRGVSIRYRRKSVADRKSTKPL